MPKKTLTFTVCVSYESEVPLNEHDCEACSSAVHAWMEKGLEDGALEPQGYTIEAYHVSTETHPE